MYTFDKSSSVSSPSMRATFLCCSAYCLCFKKVKRKNSLLLEQRTSLELAVLRWPTLLPESKAEPPSQADILQKDSLKTKLLSFLFSFPVLLSSSRQPRDCVVPVLHVRGELAAFALEAHFPNFPFFDLQQNSGPCRITLEAAKRAPARGYSFDRARVAHMARERTRAIEISFGSLRL